MTFSPLHPVLKVAMPVPLPGVFDYLLPEAGPAPVPGTRVVAPFGRRSLVGVVMGSAESSDVVASKLQHIETVLDGGEPMVTDEQARLLAWCSHYYKHPLGEVVANALPPDLRRSNGVLPPPPTVFVLTDSGAQRLREPTGRIKAQVRLLGRLAERPMTRAELRSADPGAPAALNKVLEQGWAGEAPMGEPVLDCRDGPELTREQASAVSALHAASGQFGVHLLDGVTGSGKTEVYLRLVREVLEAGRQALVLVPEIGLTPQLLQRFRDRLGIEPVVYHSGLAAGQRLRTWAAALEGRASLMIGTRSALFLPLRRPGLLVMDESHDGSFKQHDGFRFSARDVAIKRAQGLDVPIILGTATPSLESLHNAGAGRFSRLVLTERATGASQPSWKMVDLRQQATEGGLSRPAMEAIEAALGRREQVLVFLNRRGYAPVLLCHDCGWHAACARCDANMTWHQSGRRLVCHHCDHAESVPRFCPECRADALQGAGEGTEQLEQFLADRFPGTPLHRVDRDRIRRRGELETLILEVRKGDPCILVGTQMLAKGHHFPKVTLVIVVSLDQAMYSADFRAMERMGQLLMQVAGRAGRGSDPGTVVLQTHHPDHPALGTLLESGYGAFADGLREERRLAALPPWSHQAVLRAEAEDRDKVLGFLNAAARAWPDTGYAGCRLFGPLPAMMERRAGRLRWYLLLQSDRRPALQAALDSWLASIRKLKESRSVRWAVDVDPQEF